MKVEINNNAIEILYTGVISKKADFLEFKQAIEELINRDYPHFADDTPIIDNPIIRIVFYKSYPLSSYVLGYLMKLKNINKIEIEIYSTDSNLINSLKNLGLKSFFTIKKVS